MYYLKILTAFFQSEKVMRCFDILENEKDKFNENVFVLKDHRYTYNLY
jgi:hypothetical protein